MQLENRTQLEAALFRGDLPEGDRTLAVLVAKACATVGPEGRMALDLDLRTPVCREPVPVADGVIPADLGLRKQGLDVLALGQAYHPDLDGGTQSEVVLRLDRHVRRVQVFGERCWYKSHAGHWAVSDAEPFCLQSLSWHNAFGGSSFDDEGNPCPHPLNPEGKGFVASEAAVEGTALPNLEDPERRIQSWRDQPAPFSLAPAPRVLTLDLSQVAAQAERAAQQGEPFRVPDSMWNDAIPRFRFEGVLPGAAVSLSGMWEAPIHGTLPELRLFADAHVGARSLRVPLVLDTLLFLPDARRVVFTFRASFTYRFRPREMRSVTLALEA